MDNVNIDAMESVIGTIDNQAADATNESTHSKKKAGKKILLAIGIVVTLAGAGVYFLSREII